jgi:predicted lipoprotein with Yx(FWY)xxD motif
MTWTRPITFVAGTAAILLASLAIAACGDDSDTGAGAPAPKTSSGRAATIGVEDGGSLGKILVDAHGRTIYLFEKDTGPKSTCFSECAVDWPPVTSEGKPAAGKGLTASKVGTTQRADGKAQVTYSGHPLYLFEGDHSPGDLNGQGLNAFGAAWYVLSSTGNEVTGKASASSSGNSSY